MVDVTKPILLDKERDQIARAVRDGDPEKLKKLLKLPVPKLNLDGELHAFAISETSGTAYRPEEKLECLRLRFEAGATLDSAATDDIPVYMSVAENGGLALLHLMM